MKLYTLKYDCNRPTKQQINIPTNTDYKVGVKIVRNGKEQRLAPSEVTLGTLSADADKTNSYITFTEKAGDDTSCVQKQIIIDHGYELTEEEWHIMTNDTGADVTQTLLSVDLSEFAGHEIHAKDFYVSFNNAYTEEPTKADLISTLVPYWEVPGKSQYGQYQLKIIVAKANGDRIYSFKRDATFNMWIEASGWDINKPAFAYAPAGETNMHFQETFTIEEGDILQMPDVMVRKTRSAGVMFKFSSGEPFSAKFDLTENIYKSQCGDIGQAKSETSTADFSGKFANGTDFDYKLVVD